MIKHLRSSLLVIAVLTALWLLFFWRLLTPNVADRVIFPEGDFTQHFYAFTVYQMERLADGEFPLWNPYNHAGDPFAGNIQFAAFYPPRLLSALVAADHWSLEAYQLEVAAHYWLASLLMYGYLRVLLANPVQHNRDGVPRTPKMASLRNLMIAIAGAVLYAYGGYLTGYAMLQASVLASACWLPLMLLGLHLSVMKSGLRWRVWGASLGGVGMALSLLGGHPQTAMQMIYLALAYLLAITVIRSRNRIGEGLKPAPTIANVLRQFIPRAALFGMIGAGLAAVQLLPAAEFTSLSYRVTQEGFLDKANGFVPAQFLQVIWPELFGIWSPLYIGVAGLLLAVGAMLRPRPMHLFWMGVIALGALLSLGGNTVVYDVFYNVVPGFSLFRQQERIASVMSFALVMLAVYQLDWMFADSSDNVNNDGTGTGLKPAPTTPYRYSVYAYMGFLFIAYVVAAFVTLMQTGSFDPDPTSTANVFGFVAVIGMLFAVWYGWQVGKPRPVALSIPLLLLVIVVDLFTIGTRSENFLPDTPENRVTLRPALQEFQIAPDAVTWRIDGAAGLQGNGVLFSVPDIYGTGPITLESIEVLRQIPVERFWEVLAARYITTSDEPPEGVDLELLAYDTNYTGDEYRLFELRDPRPFAHLVYDYREAQGSPEFARQIMSDPRVDLREMAVTLHPLPFDLPAQRPEVSEISDFTIISPEEMTMTVSTGADALLTVALVNYPGWRADVDGERVEIVDTYAGLVSVPIRVGEDQTVRLLFAPQTVYTGAAITGITALLVLVACGGGFVLRWRRG